MYVKLIKVWDDGKWAESNVKQFFMQLKKLLSLHMALVEETIL